MWPLTAVLVRNVPTSQRGVTGALVARLGTVAVSGCFRPCRPVGPQGRPPQAWPAGDNRFWEELGTQEAVGARPAGRASGLRPPSLPGQRQAHGRIKIRIRNIKIGEKKENDKEGEEPRRR